MALFSMWKNTRMVVLVAVTAALYAAILLPFKVLVVVPGFTEIRPAAAIPVVCSLLFGPAAAWGAAIGNVVGDIFGGMLGPGSVFGFVGNFVYGLLPYTLWRAAGRREPGLRSPGQVGLFVGVCLASAAACALIVAGGVQLLGLAPFKVLLVTIFINNSLVGSLLGGILLAALYPAVSSLGLTYTQVLSAGKGLEGDLDTDEAEGPEGVG